MYRSHCTGSRPHMNDVGELLALCIFIVYSQDRVDLLNPRFRKGPVRCPAQIYVDICTSRVPVGKAVTAGLRPGSARPAVNPCPSGAGVGPWTALQMIASFLCAFPQLLKGMTRIKRCQYRKYILFEHHYHFASVRSLLGAPAAVDRVPEPKRLKVRETKKTFTVGPNKRSGNMSPG